MNKRLTVFGSKGMLGYAVTNYFKRDGWNVTPLSRNEFDIANDDHEQLKELIPSDSVVVNCAGVIKPRIAELSGEETIRVNAIFPVNLARVCSQLNVHCYHITTDCIYDGQKGAYTEEDLHNARDLYGLSKGAGDRAECMVLRTSIIGEEHGQARSLLEWIKSQGGKDANGFVNHHWNGVTTPYLAELILKIEEEGLYEAGLYHIFSPQPATKYELLRAVNEVYGLKISIAEVEAEVACDRTLATVRGLSERIAIKPIPQQITEMREFFRSLDGSARAASGPASGRSE